MFTKLLIGVSMLAFGHLFGDRLFLFKNAKIRETWQRDPGGNIAKGEAAWPSAS